MRFDAYKTYIMRFILIFWISLAYPVPIPESTLSIFVLSPALWLYYEEGINGFKNKGQREWEYQQK